LRPVEKGNRQRQALKKDKAADKTPAAQLGNFSCGAYMKLHNDKRGQPGFIPKPVQKIGLNLGAPAFHKTSFRSLSEFAITLTEDKDMAAAAMTGERSMPKIG
jgi:hypothetical protein